MDDLIQRIQKLIPSDDELAKSEMLKAYANGLNDALKAIHDSVVDNLFVNGIYYVIMYADSDENLPYIERMRLFFIKRTKKGSAFHFTKEMNRTAECKSDLILSNRETITDRVFSSFEQAKKTISF